jgi:hypothetical protein
MVLLLLIGIIIYCIYFIESNLFRIRNKNKEGFNVNNISSNPSFNKEDIAKEIKQLGLEPAIGFCEMNRASGKKREMACNKLTKDKCIKTNCCVYTNNNKCVAGTNHGPVFKTNNGVEIKVNNYTYEGKCYGVNCG